MNIDKEKTAEALAALYFDTICEIQKQSMRWSNLPKAMKEPGITEMRKLLERCEVKE
jgi:hypothetical protein